MPDRNACGFEAAISPGVHPLKIENILDAAYGHVRVCLSRDPEYVQHIKGGTAFLDRLLAEDGVAYGVTPGSGDSCTDEIPRNLVEELPLHLLRFHGCGMGKHLSGHIKSRK